MVAERNSGEAARGVACDYFILRTISDQVESRSDHYNLCLVSRLFHLAFTPGLFRHLTLDPSLEEVYQNITDRPYNNLVYVRSIHAWTRYNSGSIAKVLRRSIGLSTTPWRTNSFTKILRRATMLKTLIITTTERVGDQAVEAGPNHRKCCEVLLALPIPTLSRLELRRILPLPIPTPLSNPFPGLTALCITRTPFEAHGQGTWSSRVVDLLLRTPNLNALALSLKDTLGTINEQPSFMVMCTIYKERGGIPLNLSVLAVNCEERQGSAAWRNRGDWASVLGGLANLSQLQVLRLGSYTEDFNQPTSGPCYLTQLTAEVAPQLKLIVVPKYTREIHKWVTNLSLELQSRLGITYEESIKWNEPTIGDFLWGLYPPFQTSGFKTLRLQLDDEQDRGRMSLIIGALREAAGPHLECLQLRLSAKVDPPYCHAANFLWLKWTTEELVMLEELYVDEGNGLNEKLRRMFIESEEVKAHKRLRYVVFGRDAYRILRGKDSEYRGFEQLWEEESHPSRTWVKMARRYVGEFPLWCSRTEM
ncbi:hypothetical protein QBC34DRAFT_198949 [Podospora aff. communis PSN243]|uniref:F-box domain-containing protein n=1 Tax=Podospora aff. communis PSN243 TaxID=3040156 RepID=A0AAV9G941_9PEZI|nr:hypothetical protein QBC34DRAFT_198949 [Podospora aff. communis PSN243]